MHIETTDSAAPQRLLYPAEVAELFGVDSKTVSRWANEGRLPSFRTPGGHRRYRETEIMAIVNGGGPTDLNTLLTRASQTADRVEFDFRSNMVDAAGSVTAIAWKGDVSEYATKTTPGEALAAAVDKLAAYLSGGAH